MLKYCPYQVLNLPKGIIVLLEFREYYEDPVTEDVGEEWLVLSRRNTGECFVFRIVLP